jgi:plastocyanin
MNIGQVVVGVILLLIAVGGLLYIFYSRTNAVEKTGYGALIMLAVVSLMIPVFWIMQNGGEATAADQQYTLGVQRGMALYAQYCTNACYTIKNGKLADVNYNGFTIDQLNAMSDNQLMRVISAGIYAPNKPQPANANLIIQSQDYGGPLSTTDVQYLFDFLRSADPAYLKKNGYSAGNGFDQLVSYLQSSSPGQYATAQALGSVGQFGAPVDMTKSKTVTLTIVDSPSGASCTPACFQPVNIKVKVGTALTWVNKSTTPHTVTAMSGQNTAAPKPASNLFDSSNGNVSNLLQPGKSFSWTVTQAAYTFNSDHTVFYYCQIHPTMVAELTIVT